MLEVANVVIRDSGDKTCEATLPSDLTGCTITFDVLGHPNGDVFRIEVLPDGSWGLPKLVEEIPAGNHAEERQRFSVPLTGKARREYHISIHKVDYMTALRDPNETAPALWSQDYLV